MSCGQMLTLGLIWCSGTNERKSWQLTRPTEIAKGKRLFEAALALASCEAGLSGITTVRFGRGVQRLQPLHGFKTSELWIWLAAPSGEDIQAQPSVFEAEGKDIDRPISIKTLVEDIEKVREKLTPWTQVCFLQFLGMSYEEAEEHAITHWRIPLLGGIGAPRGSGGPPAHRKESPPLAPPVVLPAPMPHPPPPHAPALAHESVGPGSQVSLVQLPCMLPTILPGNQQDTLRRQIEVIKGGDPPGPSGGSSRTSTTLRRPMEPPPGLQPPRPKSAVPPH